MNDPENVLKHPENMLKYFEWSWKILKDPELIQNMLYKIMEILKNLLNMFWNVVKTAWTYNSNLSRQSIAIIIGNYLPTCFSFANSHFIHHFIVPVRTRDTADRSHRHANVKDPKQVHNKTFKKLRHNVHNYTIANPQYKNTILTTFRFCLFDGPLKVSVAIFHRSHFGSTPEANITNVESHHVLVIL